MNLNIQALSLFYFNYNAARGRERNTCFAPGTGNSRYATAVLQCFCTYAMVDRQSNPVTRETAGCSTTKVATTASRSTTGITEWPE